MKHLDFILYTHFYVYTEIKSRDHLWKLELPFVTHFMQIKIQSKFLFFQDWPADTLHDF